MKGIYFSNNRYGIRWWDASQKKMVHGGRFATREEAEQALFQRMQESPEKEQTPIITGASAVAYDLDKAKSLWDMAANEYKSVEATVKAKASQSIFLGNKPTGIAFLSDLHIGNAGTDYSAIMRDTELVANTPGMYAAFHGDGIDNWIVGKLQALQRNQTVSHKNEIAMFRYWLEKIHQKLLLVVSGNHDNWTAKLSGLDIIPSLLGDTHVLYDNYEVRVNIECGDGTWDTIVRHQWKYSSIFNPTHGIEVGYDRMGVPFDIGIGGHTHIGTLFRPFYRHQKERLALLTGAYKRVDSFAKEIGYAPTAANGCGAIIFMPDGKLWYNSNLEVACDYLKYLRKV
jgi:hypothetical protein